MTENEPLTGPTGTRYGAARYVSDLDRKPSVVPFRLSTFLFALPLFPALVAVAVLIFFHVRLVQSEVYKNSLAKALASQEVQEALGAEVRPSSLASGFELPFLHTHFAEWSVGLKGERGSGTLYGVATQFKGSWDVSRLVVVSGRDKLRIDLTPIRRAVLPQVPHKDVYLVPIGLEKNESIAWAPAYYQAKLGINLQLLPAVPLDAKLFDLGNKQLNANRVIELLQTTHPELARDPSAIVVGVTSSDMYIPGFVFRYAENYRLGRQYAVVSSARLHPPILFGYWNPEWLNSRLQKLLTKNVALLYFGVPMSQDHTSLVSTGVLLGTQIDEMGGDLIGTEGSWDPSPESGDPAVTIYDVPGKEQLWHPSYVPTALPDTTTQLFCADSGAGLLIQRKADMVFEDEPALQFTRVYRNQDDRSLAFGIGNSDSFDMRLGGEMGVAIDLIMEDGHRIHFRHEESKFRKIKNTISEIIFGQSEDVYQTGWGGDYGFNGTQAIYAGNSWQIKTNDGWTYTFPYRPHALPQYVSVLTGFTDPAGRKYDMERDSFGALVSVTSSTGKWLHFENDAAHRIRKVTSSLGRSVQYNYDAGGRLVRAIDSEGQVNVYTYDEKGQMLTASDGAGKPVVTDEYDENNYIKNQVMQDGRRFEYHYVHDEGNHVRENQIVDPNGMKTSIRHEVDGYVRSLPSPAQH